MGLNVQYKITNLLESNIGENLCELEFSDYFFRYNTKGIIYVKNNWQAVFHEY